MRFYFNTRDLVIQDDFAAANLLAPRKPSFMQSIFAMASGEMTEQEFSDFLTTGLTSICTHTSRGAVLYICMDWRHMGALIAAGRTAKCDLINLCV